MSLTKTTKKLASHLSISGARAGVPVDQLICEPRSITITLPAYLWKGIEKFASLPPAELVDDVIQDIMLHGMGHSAEIMAKIAKLGATITTERPSP